MKEPRPNRKLTRTGGEQGDIVSPGCQPSAASSSHSLVHARAALLSENWPELVAATSNGLFGWIWPPAICRSGR